MGAFSDRIRSMSKNKDVSNKTTLSISDKHLICDSCKRNIGSELCYANDTNTKYLCVDCYSKI